MSMHTMYDSSQRTEDCHVLRVSGANYSKLLLYQRYSTHMTESSSTILPNDSSSFPGVTHHNHEASLPPPVGLMRQQTRIVLPLSNSSVIAVSTAPPRFLKNFLHCREPPEHSH